MVKLLFGFTLCASDFKSVDVIRRSDEPPEYKTIQRGYRSNKITFYSPISLYLSDAFH